MAKVLLFSAICPPTIHYPAVNQKVALVRLLDLLRILPQHYHGVITKERLWCPWMYRLCWSAIHTSACRSPYA